MKVKGFLKDVGGASRVTKARLAAFANASPVPVTEDPIHEVAYAMHPGKIALVVTQIRPAGKTAQTFRFQAQDGRRLPLFRAGQFMVLDFPIGESLISRPYTISSSPVKTVGGDSYVEITVKRNPGGLIADYLNDSVRVGDCFMGMIGCGEFYHLPLRDAHNVVALAGGVGITPFASMAGEVAAGRLDIDLTILYGSNSSDDITMYDELTALEGEHVRVVHVIAGDEPGWQGERGFINAELIRKYSKGDTSFFICGPQGMYAPMARALDELEVPKRRRRFEVFGQPRDISVYPGYPAEKKDEVYRLTVVRGIREDVIPAMAGESLVVALERAGIRIETACRSGEC
ncbi:MAG: iron-sulfur cluster-binding domain-containing protein, partial [Oscillospiraceae bacterium]|nr:iron-sulfur cluster-binding domain-containing protein [Oscillospiraceae bacterium]